MKSKVDWTKNRASDVVGVNVFACEVSYLSSFSFHGYLLGSVLCPNPHDRVKAYYCPIVLNIFFTAYSINKYDISTVTLNWHTSLQFHCHSAFSSCFSVSNSWVPTLTLLWELLEWLRCCGEFPPSSISGAIYKLHSSIFFPNQNFTLNRHNYRYWGDMSPQLVTEIYSQTP